MSTTAKKTVLITGANRGIGLAVSKVFLNNGWRIVAGVRDPAKMPQLDGEMVVVKIDSASTTDALEAVKELESKHGITHLDIVLANAGVASAPGLLYETNLDKFDHGHVVNVRGPLALYQAVRPLLKDEGTFAVVSSVVGCITGGWMPYMGAYGSTKVALNFLMRGINHEEPKLKVFSIHPGWLDTDMGNAGAKASGIDAPPEKLSVAAPAIVQLLTNATKEETSGFMWKYDGTKLPF
ncbi:hypothetical protein IAR50_005245 [Cryptococcus sp. DSM 104548]